MRLAGFCAVAFGWPPDRFWGATPAEVEAIVVVLAPVEERPLDGAAFAKLREAFPDG